jgi:hypothetical protein
MPLGHLLEVIDDGTGNHDRNLLFPFLCIHTGILPYKNQFVKPLFKSPKQRRRTSSPVF